MKVIIKLIKREVPGDQIVKDERKIHSEEINGVGTFYYKISHSTKPEWVEQFFNGKLRCREKFKVATAAGVLLVTRHYEGDGDRTFAITFGSGRYLLCDNVTEERFGLKIALNSIEYKSLRSMDYNKMEGVPSLVRNQVSRPTGIENFDINTQVNLLRSITGTLPDTPDAVGSLMTGADSLAISTSMSVDNVTRKLDSLYGLYKSDVYKQHFAWVDNISAIADQTVIRALDQELLAKINQRVFENVWLALPSIVEWTNIDHLKYSGRNRNQHPDVVLSEAVTELYGERNDIRPFELKIANIKAYDNGGTLYKEWSLYKCLNVEIIYQEKLYVLNDGSWYQVDRNFYESVERVYNDIGSSGINFISWRPRFEEGKEKFEKEKIYNERLADSDTSLCNMDRDLVYLNGNQDKIEFCDVFSNTGQIIHVKRKGGSELIGHLLNQGYVSATLMLTEEFRNKLNAKLKESNKDAWMVEQYSRDFDANRYSIVYGVLCNDNEARVKLPFFSKVILKEVVTALRNFGFRVYLDRINKEQVERCN